MENLNKELLKAEGRGLRAGPQNQGGMGTSGDWRTEAVLLAPSTHTWLGDSCACPSPVIPDMAQLALGSAGEGSGRDQRKGHDLLGQERGCSLWSPLGTVGGGWQAQGARGESPHEHGWSQGSLQWVWLASPG